jgi:hypothetical protein
MMVDFKSTLYILIPLSPPFTKGDLGGFYVGAQCLRSSLDHTVKPDDDIKVIPQFPRQEVSCTSLARARHAVPLPILKGSLD